DDQAARVHGRVRRDDRPDAALRKPDVPVDPDLGPGPVVVVEAAGQTRPEEPVLDGQVREAERLEDRVGGHAQPLSYADAKTKSMAATPVVASPSRARLYVRGSCSIATWAASASFSPSFRLQGRWKTQSRGKERRACGRKRGALPSGERAYPREGPRARHV